MRPTTLKEPKVLLDVRPIKEEMAKEATSDPGYRQRLNGLGAKLLRGLFAWRANEYPEGKLRSPLPPSVRNMLPNGRPAERLLLQQRPMFNPKRPAASGDNFLARFCGA